MRQATAPGRRPSQAQPEVQFRAPLPYSPRWQPDRHRSTCPGPRRQKTVGRPSPDTGSRCRPMAPPGRTLLPTAAPRARATPIQDLRPEAPGTTGYRPSTLKVVGRRPTSPAPALATPNRRTSWWTHPRSATTLPQPERASHSTPRCATRAMVNLLSPRFATTSLLTRRSPQATRRWAPTRCSGSTHLRTETSGSA